MITELEQIEQAIRVLDAQRSTLGDAVVDTALAPLREKLAALAAREQPREAKRKLVTILFADISGFTAMSEKLDAEEVTELLNALWARLDIAITSRGGQIDKHTGDGVMAIWGADAAREDDPERAVLAALDMQAALASFQPTQDVSLGLRVGINTGPVLLGEIGLTREFTAMGDAVNLASRLENAAPVGQVLISHDTYRHVAGLFELRPQALLPVKGKREPIQTYLVQRARPQAFCMHTRGIEGVDTRMVGRETELGALQKAYQNVVETGETRLLVITGEAGMGKSRLLHEFEKWLDQYPGQAQIFKGRATPVLQGVPYGIIRDLFASKFDILESDNAAAALEKFRAGMGGILPPEKADLIGHWIGFDFSNSPAVQKLAGISGFGRLAQAYLGNYLRAVAVRQPTLLFLDDLHWADDSSLDLIDHLAATMPRSQLLLVGLTRPHLFERQPGWGQRLTCCSRLDLKLLSLQDSCALVDEILKKVDVVPDSLRGLVVGSAEGNPYYLEELLKMMLDAGVIEPKPGESDRWRVNLERLEATRIPPTLTGILQARLDSLPRSERELLQCAAVVGRVFWDAAVSDVLAGERRQVRTILEAIGGREMISWQEHSAFAGAQQYAFKHTLLHDVTYETVLLKLRRDYHASTAHWLETHAGERISEYAGLIAGHLERANLAEQAIHYLRLAGERALGAYAYREAADYFKRALSHIPDENIERTSLLVQLGETMWYLGEYEQAQTCLQEGLTLGEKHGQAEYRSDALVHLGAIARKQGSWAQARAHLIESLDIARQVGNQNKIANALHNLAWVDIRQGVYLEARAKLAESRMLYQAQDNRSGLADVLNGLGTVSLNLGEYDETRRLYQESLAIFREVGDRPGESAALVNLGEAARRQGDYEAARNYYEAALKIDHEIGDELLAAMTLGNLGHTSLACQDYAAAEEYYRKGLQAALEINDLPDMLDILSGLSGVLLKTARQEQALIVLGAVLCHPALEDESRAIADQALESLQARFSPREIEAGLASGRGQTLAGIIIKLLETHIR
jgi:predicted ATPase/class 3 adenylate cyclase